MKKVFLVGAPRSGTTYLLSLLARNRHTLCLPESQFFADQYEATGKIWHTYQSAPIRRELRRMLLKLGYGPAGRTSNAVRRLQARVKISLHEDDLKSWRLRTQAKALTDSLDMLAINEGCLAWCEKSPNHVFLIDEISALVPDAYFIHIVRDGRSVVGSICELMSQDESWCERYRSAAVVAKMWRASIEVSTSHIGHHRHAIVRYSDAVASPEMVVRNLETFLQLPSDRVSKALLTQKLDRMIYDNEPWKHGVRSSEHVSVAGKFETYLDADARQAVLEIIANTEVPRRSVFGTH